MPFIKDQSKCKVELIKVGIVDICDDAIEKVVKMAKTLLTSINVMQCSDVENVPNILLHLLEYGSGLFQGYRWDGVFILTQF